MTKHTDGAVKAAVKVERVIVEHGYYTIQEIAAIIDQETGLPELKARIDQFEVEISDLNESWETEFKQLEAENEKLKADLRATPQPGRSI